MSSITDDVKRSIFEIADNLYKAANFERFPRVVDVRDVARCDMATATEVMKIWRQDSKSKSAKQVTIVPQKVSEAFNSAIGNLWVIAETHAMEAAEALKAQYESALSSANSELKDVSDAYDRLEHEHAENLECIASLRAEVIELRDTVAGKQIELVNAQRLQESSNYEIKQISEQIGQKDRALAQLQQNLDKATHDLTTTRSELGVANERLSAEKTRSEQGLAELKGCKAALKEAESALKAEQILSAECNGRVSELSNQVESLIAELKGVRSSDVLKVQKITELQQKIKFLEQQLKVKGKGNTKDGS